MLLRRLPSAGAGIAHWSSSIINVPEKSRDFLLWAGGPGVVAFFVVHRAQKARFALRPRTSSVTAWLAFLVFEDVEVFTRIDLYYLTLFYTLLISMGFATGLAIMEAQVTGCPA